MKWSKRPKSLTEKGEFGPHTLPISGRFPKEALGASWHWQVGITPTVFCHKPYEITMELQSRAPYLLHAGHAIHSHKHTVPPSLLLSLSQRQSTVNPGQLTWEGQNATFSLGLPPQPLWTQGWSNLLGDAHKTGRGAGLLCREKGSTD